MKKSVLLIYVFAFALIPFSFAQTCLLMKSDPSKGKYSGDFVLSNGYLFFNGYGSGMELYKSDGTEAGTIMVKDILPGGNSGAPKSITDFSGTIFFSADDGTNGRELWKSDGTEAGTVMIKNINPAGASAVSNIINVNGTAFFTANDGTNGIELWKSDGTDAGTILVKNIHPSGNSNPANFIIVNGVLFFTATDGTNGIELWKSDGTDGGTVLVKNIHPSGNSDPVNLTEMGGVLYFAANDGTNGTELWKSDGTDAGTLMVKDIFPSGNANIEYLINGAGTLYFAANDGINGSELWKSDGTSSGTEIIIDIQSGSGSSFPDFLYYANGLIFFSAYQTGYGEEIWRSDGTAAGTFLLKDLVAGSAGGGYGRFFTAYNNLIFFMGYNDVFGVELWQTDGTEMGTQLVEDINPGTSDSYAQNLIVYNNNLYFKATDDTESEVLRTYSLPPSVKASSFSVSPVTGNAQTLTWTNGDGQKRIVVARATSAVSFTPQTGTEYIADAAFASGADIGSGEYIVYNGTGNSVTVTGLTNGTDYYYTIYEYNGICPDYLVPGTSNASPTGIIDLVEKSIQLYPNPVSSSEQLYIHSSSLPVESVQLYNIQGNLERETTTDNLSLQGLSPGLYMVKINFNQNSVMSRLVIK